MKVILKKIYKKDVLDLFIQRIKTVNTTFTDNNNVKFNEIIENNEYIILIRQKWCNSIEMMENNELNTFILTENVNKMLLTICDVVSEFHKNGFYHGGIKLSNIFINKENGDEYFIADHCIRMINTKEYLNINKKTINYITPEELNEKEISIEIDLWLIGVLLYKLLKGNYPFGCDSLLESELKIIKVEYENTNNKENEKYNEIIDKLLVKNGKRRMKIDNLKKELLLLLNINKSKENITTTSPSSLSSSEDCYFIENHKHIDIIITNNNKTITKVMPINNFAHCYLNIKMNEGIHHFIYQIKGYGCSGFFFGGSSNNEYEGDILPEEEDSCCIAIVDKGSKLFGNNGYKVKDGIFDDIKAKDGGKYEMIFDCNDNKVYIKEENEKEVILIWKDIKLPLFPFVSILYPDFTVDLIDYYKESK